MTENGLTAVTRSAQRGKSHRRGKVPGPLTRAERAREFASRLGLTFSDLRLLELALTHRSTLNDIGGNAPAPTLTNERLEFLGDAVLGLVVAKYLFAADPEASEGTLTQRRVALVRAESLVRWAREIELGDALTVGHGERPGPGARDRMLAGAFEALIGAVALDQGDDAAAAFIHRFLDRDGEELTAEADGPANPKGQLQQWLQSRHRQGPAYRVVSAEGPEHERVFTVEVTFRGDRIGTGTGASKREAEQHAAEDALLALEAQSEPTGTIAR